MIRYKFVARSPTGNIVKGYLKLENEEELKKVMYEQNYRLIRYRKAKEKKQIFTFKKITKKHLVSLAEKLVMLLKSGVSLSESLDIAAESFTNKKFKEIIQDLSIQIKKGKTFSSTLYEYPKYFPEFFRTMISLAEQSGKLIDILNYIIDYYNYEIQIKKKIISSLFYPILLVILGLAVLIVVSIVIIPTFASIFKQMNVEVPLITRIIINISNFIKSNFIYILIGLIIIITLMILFFHTNKGKYINAKLKTKMPLIKNLYVNNIVTRFCKSLEILLHSGMPTVICLQTSANLIGNCYVEEELYFSIDLIKRGDSLSQSLESINLFPKMLIQTLMISEKTASLDYSLQILAKIYEEESKHRLQRISNIIEPLFILFISGFVVLLIVAIFVPLLSMLDGIGSF